MESCFASRQRVNNYLIWAIRMVNHPVSTIAKTLLEDEGLRNIVEEKSKNTHIIINITYGIYLLIGLIN